MSGSVGGTGGGSIGGLSLDAEALYSDLLRNMQALASRYLVPCKSWSAVVLPDGVAAK